MRRVLGLFLLLLAWPDPTRSVVADMYQDGSNAKLPEARTNLGVQTIDPVKDYGADPTGVGDSQAAMVAAVNRCTALGGGVIDITGYRIKTSGNYSIPANCIIRGSYVPTSPGGNYAARTSVLIPGGQIGFGHGAGIANVLVLSPTWVMPTTAREAIAQVATFAARGNALSIGGHGAMIHDVQIIGFDHGIDSPAASLHDVRNVHIDANVCVNQANAGDVVYYSHIHCFPYVTASTPGGNPTTTVTGTPTDNGSGLIRVPVASTAAFVTGDTLTVHSIGGYAAANGKWPVTVVDATHIDLQGSQSSPTATANIVTGSNVITLSARNCSVRSGQTIGTTVNITGTVVWTDDCTRVYISNPATGANAADPVTFTHAAYTGAGTVMLDILYRSGAGFAFSNNIPATDKSYVAYCNSCFVFGHEIGFDINNDAGDNFSQIGVDGAQMSTSIGVRFRGAAHGNQVVSAGLIGDRPIVSTSSAADYSNIVANAHIRPFNTAGAIPAISVTSGLIQINNSNIMPTVGTVSSVYVGSGTARASFCGDDFTNATFYWQNDATYLTKLFICPGVLYGAGPLMAKRELWTFSTNGNLAAGTTLYASTGLGTNAAEANAAAQIDQGGNFRNLVCTNSAAPGVGQTHTVTVRTPVAGTDSPVTCTIADAGRSCLDTTHITLGGGRQAIKLVASAGAAAANVQCSVTITSP